ncbi:ABC transporter ATP-binding protein [Natronincola ferrireducens]|uniref:ATP-binding cassette, subfamily B, MsbA n=1 Tax=Natronincola ferrireducens TaxID=393762 RepID=A0A1G9A289_9FIRM|nr:ABC transporter ATP-binding protein [Natronincola ferrireducens]SDK21509.1 ATP-binding cassette, subfamily B, MsbA [Natronincola ferrireducens]
MRGFHRFNEENVGKSYDKKLMARLLKYAKPYWLFILLSIFLLTLIAGIDIARPYIIKLAIDDYMEVYSREAISGLRNLSFFYFLLILLGFFLNFLQIYLLNYTSNKIVFEIRQQLFEHLQKMSLGFFDHNPVGRLVTRVTNDTETLHEMYTGVLVNLFKDIFLLVGIMIIMVKMHLQLALLCFALIPIVLLTATFFRSRVRAIYREVRAKLGTINALLNANFNGMKTIHIFNRESQQFEEFDRNNQELLYAHKKQNLIYAVFRPTMEIIRSLGIAVILWYGGGKVLQGKIEFGILFAFINYIKQFFQPIQDLTEKYNVLQSAMASSERIFALLDEEPSIQNAENPMENHCFKGEIEFKNVWFAYKEEDWVLKDISFKINPGESIAFVGPTGAGKSSIIHLMGRFYDVQKGEILMDGVNIQLIPLKDLRKNIGILMQDVFLFAGTIKENIVLNNNNFSDEAIKSAAEYVNAHRFIEKLPNKYNEPIVEKGNNLSTGQRQLLSFARALMYDPKVLILDEATSNIDTETEKLIQATIEKIIKNKTTIAIAHRLSTVQSCNKIIVLHKGRIYEHGNHQQLLQKKGLYYHLYQLQHQKIKESL